MNSTLFEKKPDQAPKSELGWAPFRLAFRPFFLFGSLFSCISLLAWNGLLNGQLVLEVYGNPLWWHTHEMLFGFVAAIVAGFLLTAVQTWTQLPSVKGIQLMGLFLLWLSARVLMWIPNSVSPWVILILDLLFLPMTAFIMARLVLRAKLWRNLMFVPLLLAMTLANGCMHYAVLTQQPGWDTQAAEAMVILVTLLMCILGGRVFPMFTANGTQTGRVQALGWLEKTSVASLLAVFITQVLVPDAPAWLTASLLFASAALQALRAFRWRIWVTFGTPLVWPLHISYWCIPLGLALLGWSEIGQGVTRSQAIHSLTVGAMGIMILAMISRVSLGHTGRVIQVGKIMSTAFIFLVLAFLVRVFGSYFYANYLHLLTFSTLLWTAGYSGFVIANFPVLTQPRIDGKPG
ncbi:NnrS family protein [Teredinibacter haidensis]|uniref:NnrS family protein n=1 Tax=Teredinibacter haidensis TaxID=2731755 RepID=UPI00094892E8|nr:NnrS family protein [Teredinibacter haidensis]